MKLDQLTFTRFIAAIAIVIYHFGTNYYPFNLPFIKNLFNNANLAVSYFFVLSGFVMIVAYNESRKIIYSDYYINRFARIYPIYFIAFVLIIPYSYIYDKPNFNLANLLSQLTCLQAWLPDAATKLNFPGWSISVEVLFYVLFPILYNKIYKNFKVKLILLPVFVLWIISQIIFNFLLLSSFNKGAGSTSHNFLFYFPLLHLNQFIIGNIAGLLYIKVSKKKRNYNLATILLILLLTVIVRYKGSLNLHNGALALLFSAFIITLSLNNSHLMTFIAQKKLIFLGEISFSIYILQTPVMRYSQIAFRGLGILNQQIIFYLYLVLLIAISTASYLFIECPIRNIIREQKFYKR